MWDSDLGRGEDLEGDRYKLLMALQSDKYIEINNISYILSSIVMANSEKPCFDGTFNVSRDTSALR